MIDDDHRTSEASIEGEAGPPAKRVAALSPGTRLRVGATRAKGETSEASIEGESLRALLVEGATRAPLIEISVPLRNGMVRYPGDPAVRMVLEQDLDRGDPVNLTVVHMSAHAGTHIDAPRHFLKGGISIDLMPIEAVNGPARVIAVDDEESIKVSHIENHDIRAGDILLFKTSNSSLWRHSTFQKGFVYLSTPAAVYLAQKGISAVGIDYLSIDGYGKNEGGAHRTLLESSVWIIEGLDLSAVEPGVYELLCLPLRIQGAEAAPARALLRPYSAQSGLSD